MCIRDRSEHDLFAGILKENGAEVVYLEDRMAEVLKADPAVKENFVKQFISESGNTAQKFKNQLYDCLLYTSRYRRRSSFLCWRRAASLPR